MGHRKQTHRMVDCKKFLKNSCSFSSDKCWYTHKDEEPKDGEPKAEEPKDEEPKFEENLVEMNEQKNEEHDNNTGAKAPGFWEAPSNLAPPSGQAPLSQATWIKMTSMMMDLKNMKEEIQKLMN